MGSAIADDSKDAAKVQQAPQVTTDNASGHLMYPRCLCPRHSCKSCDFEGSAIRAGRSRNNRVDSSSSSLSSHLEPPAGRIFKE